MPVGTILTAYSILQVIGGFQGKQDFPKLKNEAGEWMPLYYTTHNRAPASDLNGLRKDKHTICDETTGIPVARWSYSKQEVQPVMGFTIEGYPVYVDVGPEHEVWTRLRSGVEPALSTPGTNGQIVAHKGAGPKGVNAVKGLPLAEALGMYGPLSYPVGETPAPFGPGGDTGRSKGNQAGTLPGILAIGGIAALAGGFHIPGAIAIIAAAAMNRAGTMPDNYRGSRPGRLQENPDGLPENYTSEGRS